MSSPPSTIITGLYERDIDLLLLEELSCTPNFCQWFAQQVVGTDSPKLRCLSVEHSATTMNGESDLELRLEGPNSETVMILIENKVNAQFQPRQAERYRERAQQYQSEGRCNHYYTALVAPIQYLGSEISTKGFDVAISYEQIAEWFRQQSGLGNRARYKAQLLSDASQKIKHEADEPVTDFWQRFWKLTRTHTPELLMKEPMVGGRTANSDFMTMTPAIFPKNVGIVYKFTGINETRPMAAVDLQIGSVGIHTQSLSEKIHHLLEPDMAVARAAKSASVRILTPALHPHSSTDEDLLEGLAIATRLFEWYKQHKITLDATITELRNKDLITKL